MNDNEKQFEDFVSNIKFDDTPDPKHRDKLEQNLLCAMAKKSRQIKIWRIIMKSQITKLAAAAVIVLAVVLSVTILNHTTTPVWAIEQTIEAIEGFKAIYSSGITVDEDGIEFEVEFWARTNKDGTGSGDFRMETKGGKVTVVNEEQNVTYKYDPSRNVVLVESGIRFYCRPWVDGKFFRIMKDVCTDWKEEYRKDESIGGDCVFVTARNPESSQSYEFQFDLRTKLPIRGKVWQNSDFEGKPNITANKIIYNPVLPDGIFDFEIPEGATVIEE